jgi:hypothetical protein
MFRNALARSLGRFAIQADVQGQAALPTLSAAFPGRLRADPQAEVGRKRNVRVDFSTYPCYGKIIIRRGSSPMLHRSTASRAYLLCNQTSLRHNSAVLPPHSRRNVLARRSARHAL